MIKRTPPKSNTECMSHHSSEPDLTSPKLELTADRVTIRQKRKYEHEFGDQLQALREDIIASIATTRKEQSEKFRTLQSDLDQIKAQNTELQKTVEFLSHKYDNLMDKITHLEQEKKDTYGYIRSLEDKVQNLERNEKNSSLEIRNVPKIHGESKEDLINIIKTIGAVVNYEIQAHDLKDIYRLSSNRNPQTNGPITAEFISTLTKDRLLTNIKKYNRNNKTNRLNSSIIKMEGNVPIYISESLTTATKKLYYQVREFSKMNDYAYHWTSHGKIYIKKKEGAPTKRIDKESDLEVLCLKQQEK